MKSIADVAVAWAKKRFVEKAHKRPKTIDIRGEAGQILVRIEVQDKESAPKILVPDDHDDTSETTTDSGTRSLPDRPQ